MIRWQLFRKFILFRNFGRERVLWEGNADCQEAGELEVTFRCFIAFWLLEHCQKYHDITMPTINSFKQWLIGMSTYYPFWGFVLRKGFLIIPTRLFMQCNPYNPRCSVSPMVQSGRDKLKTIPPSLTWCLRINVANPEYLSEDICITIYIYLLIFCSGEMRHGMEAVVARRSPTRGIWGRACLSAGPKSGTRSSLQRTVSERI